MLCMPSMCHKRTRGFFHVSTGLPSRRPRIRIKAIDPKRFVIDWRGTVATTRTPAAVAPPPYRPMPRSWLQPRPKGGVGIRRLQRNKVSTAMSACSSPATSTCIPWSIYTGPVFVDTGDCWLGPSLTHHGLFFPNDSKTP